MKNNTIKFVSIAFSIFCGCALTAQTNNIAINTTGAPPDASSMLDISSTTQGMLIPRMTRAQRVALAPVQGLTVYQTNIQAGDNNGFWVYINTATGWVQMLSGENAWELTGNTGTLPVSNYLGTTDNQPLIFRTNNIERGRITNTGELLVGTPPSGSAEKLQIDGAIRQIGAAATNDAGTIQWDAALNRHLGNVDGTATGWERMENPYDEVLNANYTQIQAPVCAPGFAYIPENNLSLATNNAFVVPFRAGVNGRRRRVQWLLRRDELDIQLAQLNNASLTDGLCANQPITSVAFYMNSWVGPPVNTTNTSVTIMHTQFSSMSTAAGFDNNYTDAQCACRGVGCAGGNGFIAPVNGAWMNWNFGAPFVWDGVSNVIIEFTFFAGGNGNITPNATTTVAYTNTGFPASMGFYGSSAALCAVYNPTNSAPLCDGPGSFNIASGINPSACTLGGTSNFRPIFRFNGTTATALPPQIAQDDYVQYSGGLVVEENNNYALNQAGPLQNWAFRGPGTINAENGVFANGMQLNDHVFDLYFDGRVSADEADDFGYRRHMDVEEMTNFIETRRHLPTMKGRIDWIRGGGFSLDDLTNQLWQTAETQALYLTEMNDRMDVLEMLYSDRLLNTKEHALLSEAILNMSNITDGEKQQLLDNCAARVETSSNK